jgi:hypothetical protein
MNDKIITLDMTRQPDLPEDYKTLKAFAQEFRVETEEDFQIATELIQKSARWMSSVEVFFDEGKKKAHAAHRWFTQTIAGLCAPYDVRPVLQPKMVAFRKRQDDERRAAEEKARREAEAAEQAARAEAERIRLEAERAAAELRKQGELKAAREMQAEAAEQAQNVVEQAQAIADVGTILPAAPKVAGLGESRPWIGVIDDPMEVIKAVAAGKVPLMFTLPKRGGGMEEVPLLEVNQRVVTEMAKRLGRPSIGIPGCRGEREVGLRFSKSAAAAPVSRNESDW